MNEHLRALDVTEKLMPEPMTLVRTLDQSRDVGDDEAAVSGERDDAKRWSQRRERVVCNLGLCCRDTGNERGLAGVGIADETDVGEKFQLQPQEPFFARFARLRFSWGAIRGRREVRVAESAASTLCDKHALSNDGQIGELFELTRLLRASRKDECADRNRDVAIDAVASRFVRALAAAAARSFEFRIEAEVNECVAVWIRYEVDRTAAAAVAAVRPAARDELLTSKAERAPTAITGFDVNVDFVDEH